MVSEEVKKFIKTEPILLNILRKIQELEGFLSEDALAFVSEELDIPLARLYDTASFYSFLTLKKRSKHVIRVCNSPSCYLTGSSNVLTIVEKLTGLRPGEHNADFTFEITPCIGCCDKPPAMMIDDRIFTELNEEKLKKILKKTR